MSLFLAFFRFIFQSFHVHLCLSLSFWMKFGLLFVFSFSNVFLMHTHTHSLSEIWLFLRLILWKYFTQHMTTFNVYCAHLSASAIWPKVAHEFSFCRFSIKWPSWKLIHSNKKSGMIQSSFIEQLQYFTDWFRMLAEKEEKKMWHLWSIKCGLDWAGLIVFVY